MIGLLFMVFLLGLIWGVPVCIIVDELLTRTEKNPKVKAYELTYLQKSDMREFGKCDKIFKTYDLAKIYALHRTMHSVDSTEFRGNLIEGKYYWIRIDEIEMDKKDYDHLI